MGSPPADHSTWPVRKDGSTPTDEPPSHVRAVEPAVATMADLLMLAEVLEPSRLDAELSGEAFDESFDDSEVETARPALPPPAPGDLMLGLALLEPLDVAGAGVSWRALAPDGRERAVHALPSRAPQACRQAFERNGALLEELGRRNVAGIIRVLSRSDDGMSYSTELEPLGTVLDVPVLGWPLAKRLELFKQICGLFTSVHAEGLVVGGWWPGDIALDDALHPVLTRVVAIPALALPEHDMGAQIARYFAPEVLAGEVTCAGSDVFALGRALHFLLIGKHPPAAREPLPLLNDIASMPAGLIRIVRKCCIEASYMRYGSVEELLVDLSRYGEHALVGLSHPDSTESNFTGFSNAPVRPRERNESAKRGVSPRIWRRRERADMCSAERVSASVPWLAAAAACLIGACGAAFALPGGHMLVAPLATLAPLAGALVALGMPTSAERPLVGRLAFGICAAALIYMLGPVAAAAELGAERRFVRGDPIARASQIRAWVDSGRQDFEGAQLARAPLAAIDLAHTALANADLSHADLSGADLSGADLTLAHLSGTRLHGAMLEGAAVDLASDFDRASCDAATVMPDGWSCADGHPARATEGTRPPETGQAAATGEVTRGDAQH